MDFAQICAAPPEEFSRLGQQVALCAAQGRNYELPACRLPAACRPGRVTLGFCRREGGYLLYWRPAVDYGGQSPVLKLLFGRSAWRFDRFEELTRFLHSLSPALAAECTPAPAPVPKPARTAADLPRRERDAGVWPGLYLRLRAALSEQVLGQERAVESTAFRLYTHIIKQSPSRPLSLIFYGPTGVGKSELGKAVAPALSQCCGKPYQLVWTELNTFTQPHSVHRLTGAPPGYVGYEDAPILDAVRRDPRTVFMFDELEKAHPEVLKVFMSILDEGRCTAHRADAQGGRELDFRQCVLLFTTNADLTARGGRPVGFSAPEASETAPSPETCEKAAASPAELAKRLFQENESARQAMVRLGILPEIAGRFGGLIPFRALDESARQAVTVKQIQSLGREYGLRITSVDPRLAQALTPGEEALSARSNACVLESLLAPLFSSPALPRTALRLTGTLSAPQLVPAQLTTLTRPLAASRL